MNPKMKYSTRIVSIETLPVESLETCEKINSETYHVVTSENWKPVAMRVPALFTVEESIADKERIYAATLEYTTCERPQRRDRLVYKLTTANGKFILLGTNERPYPITLAQENHPSESGEAEGWAVRVTYQKAAPIPYIGQNW